MVAYPLVIVGAHNGSQSAELVAQRSLAGPVLLVEPIPYLFEQLRTLHAGNDAVEVLNAAITEEDVDHVDFYAPRPESSSVVSYADQLGSLSPQHATSHDAVLAGMVEQIRVPAITFERLIERYRISDIDLLITDTEGFDATLLVTFPFAVLRPRRIVFEFKHSDGVFRIGRRLAGLLIRLDDNGYHTSVLDIENCMATLVD